MRVVVSVFWLFIISSNAFAEYANAPASKVFPYLSEYIALAADERSHFEITYQIDVNKPMNEPIQLWFKMENGEKSIPIDINNFVQWKSVAQEIAADDVIYTNIPKGGGGVAFSIEPDVPNATSLKMDEIQLSLDQANAAIRSYAGFLRFAAPRMKGVSFTLPEGASAHLLIDGEIVALKIGKDGAVEIKPKKRKFRKAQAIEFSAAPIADRFID